uniref:Transposase n=1 Tax=Ascaris lumbricoides TaxID=6252 RepID=A0A0M3ISA6_ASCLU
MISCQVTLGWTSAAQLIIDARRSVSAQKVKAGRIADARVDFNGGMLGRAPKR